MLMYCTTRSASDNRRKIFLVSHAQKLMHFFLYVYVPKINQVNLRVRQVTCGKKKKLLELNLLPKVNTYRHMCAYFSMVIKNVFKDQQVDQNQINGPNKTCTKHVCSRVAEQSIVIGAQQRCSMLTDFCLIRTGIFC